MNTFQCLDFAATLIGLQGLKCRCDLARAIGKDEEVGKFVGKVREELDVVITRCKEAGFSEAKVHASLVSDDLLDEPVRTTFSSITRDLQRVEDALLMHVQKRRFLRVQAARATYVDNPEFLGSAVSTAFKSAAPDVREAGNCLAADCNTAAVFHLMRVLEWGLRALCVHLGMKRFKSTRKRDRTITYTPIEYKEWDSVLNQLQGKVDAKVNKIKRGPAKQQAQEFYYPVLQELRAMRDAWRNHVMHTRQEYSARDADAILAHVERFMTTLSARVSQV